MIQCVTHKFSGMNRALKFFAGVWLVALLCVLATPLTAIHWTLATAQTETASISGTIVDPQGGLIPDVEVQILNTDMGTTVTTKTNGAGVYTAPGLIPGHYRMVVTKHGFKQVDVRDIILNVQDSLNRNFTLDLGASSETIQVNGSGLTINTTDGSVGTVIDRDFVANIPLNGRSFQDLISLTPGVVTQSPQAGGGPGFYGAPTAGDFSVNGQRTESNTYIVDGISGNTSPGLPGLGPGTGGNLGASTALGTTQGLISVDALQEFRVESSTYSAEYGGSPGGQFSFLSRSGANSFHGSLFEYLRNDAFDANDWFNDYLGVAKPSLRQNDFGGTIGGPVWIPHIYNGKNKTFFFFSYEGLRLREPTEASEEYVPSDSLRASAASVLQPALNAYPLPTGPEIQIACDNVTYQCAGQPVGTLVPSGLAPFVKAYSLPNSINSVGLRLDQAVGDRVHIFVRAAYTPSAITTRNLSDQTSIIENTQAYTAGVDVQVSSNMTDQVRVGYSRTISSNAPVLDNFGGATPTSLAEVFGISSYPDSSSAVNVFFPGIGRSEIVTGTTSGYQYQWNINNTVNWELGRHSLKAGISYRRLNSPYSVSDPLTTAVYRNPGTIETNSATDILVERQRSPSPLYNQFALFVQDEWKLTPDINLSFGVRWEVEPPPTSTNSVKPYPLVGNTTDPSTYSLGVAGTPIYKTTWGNFAPRLGVAWKARGTAGTETVVRGGVGIFYDTGTQSTSSAFDGIGSLVYTVIRNVPAPVTPAQLNLSFSTTPPYTSTLFVANNFKLPYTIEWNTAIQQALGKNQSLTVTYLGSKGGRLVEENYLSGGTLNPEFTQVYLFQNGLTSNYQALEAQFQRRLSHGLAALASYTWSHSLDYGSTGDEYGYYYRRGNSDFDLRNSFNAGMTWDLPLTHGIAFSRALLNGWGLDGRIFARSGFPVGLQGDFYVNPVTGVGSYSGLNIVPGQPIYIYGSQCAAVYANGLACPGGRAINPNAFTSVAPGSVGNAPRNFVRGFGETQLNLAIRREFPLHENLRLQFRAEAFNIFNHPNFGYIDPYLDDATFGQATATLAQSLGTVSPLYQQGGARSMQFALKLLF